MLSPQTAPTAATTMTTTRIRFPVAAPTPAVMTAVSLGMSGMTESSRANRNRNGYVHHASEIRSRSESSMEPPSLSLVDEPVGVHIRERLLHVDLVAHRGYRIARGHEHHRGVHVRRFEERQPALGEVERAPAVGPRVDAVSRPGTYHHQRPGRGHVHQPVAGPV